MTTMDYAATYDPELDFDRHYSLATIRRICDYVRPGDRVLELGCATGLMTAELTAAGARVTVVDRSAAYLERVRARGLDSVEIVQADLADLPPTGEHEHAVLANVLHELDDPVAVLANAAARLTPGGFVHTTLQNPQSIHRLAALELGLLDDLTEVAERGRQWGTKRLYTADELAALGRAAGLTEVHREGVLLKPLPNAQMAELPDTAVEGLIRVARHFPDHCAMNYLVLRHA
jgi:2-polyprenyl-3-methyl-5-hydroxy-6-metoxy-1,4-benzoquinol methylase